MDDATYRHQLQRRDQILAELKAVEEYLRAYENLFKISSSPRPAAEPSRAAEPRRRERNVIAPARLAAMAREAILKHGRPMTRGELVDAFEASGIPLAGQDKAKNIGTIMWRFRDDFLNVPGRGYWPKDAPNKEVQEALRGDGTSASSARST